MRAIAGGAFVHMLSLAQHREEKDKQETVKMRWGGGEVGRQVRCLEMLEAAGGRWSWQEPQGCWRCPCSLVAGSGQEQGTGNRKHKQALASPRSFPSADALYEHGVRRITYSLKGTEAPRVRTEARLSKGMRVTV